MLNKTKRASDHETVMNFVSAPKPEPRKKKQANPPIDKQAYLEFRQEMGFGMLCDCGCGQLGTTIHHCIIGRHKGHPELDDYRNYALVNMWEDSTRKFDNRKWRMFFYQLNEKRFYRDVMWLWVESLPEKMRSRIDWL